MYRGGGNGESRSGGLGNLRKDKKDLARGVEESDCTGRFRSQKLMNKTIWIK